MIDDSWNEVDEPLWSLSSNSNFWIYKFDTILVLYNWSIDPCPPL